MDNDKIIEDMYKFISHICIESGCGYDLKQISVKILTGKLTYEEAKRQWLQRGYYLM